LTSENLFSIRKMFICVAASSYLESVSIHYQCLLLSPNMASNNRECLKFLPCFSNRGHLIILLFPNCNNDNWILLFSPLDTIYFYTPCRDKNDPSLNGELGRIVSLEVSYFLNLSTWSNWSQINHSCLPQLFSLGI
jgi:hypothetical protein